MVKLRVNNNTFYFFRRNPFRRFLQNRRSVIKIHDVFDIYALL